MKLDATLLYDFIKKASLNGKIMTINMEFKEDGVLSSVRDYTNTAMTRTFLKKEAFAEYDVIGEIFIKNTEQFLRYIKTFGGEVEIFIKDEYILIVKDVSREAQLMLGSDIVCENVVRTEPPNIETKVVTELEKEDLARTFGDVNLLKINKVKITRKEKEIIFEIGEEGESDLFKNIIKTKEGEESNVSVGEIFCAFYDSLDGKFSLEIKDEENPLKLIEKTEEIDFLCIIAPLFSDK